MTALFRSPWEVLTSLGAAGLMLPVLVQVCIGLWQTGQSGTVVRWLALMALGTALVLATKIAFLSFGIGSAALDFTGISGHATLATAILPVWLGWVLARDPGRHFPTGMLAGLALGALVGWSRIILGAHSVSESALGWLLGAVIASLTWRLLDRRIPAPRLVWGAGLVLLLALSPNFSSYLPTRDWEKSLALIICGCEVLHSRDDFRVSPPRVSASAGLQ
jgi:membrane-associated phospholipid phosphatase